MITQASFPVNSLYSSCDAHECPFALCINSYSLVHIHLNEAGNKPKFPLIVNKWLCCTASFLVSAANAFEAEEQN